MKIFQIRWWWWYTVCTIGMCVTIAIHMICYKKHYIFSYEFMLPRSYILQNIFIPFLQIKNYLHLHNFKWSLDHYFIFTEVFICPSISVIILIQTFYHLSKSFHKKFSKRFMSSNITFSAYTIRLIIYTSYKELFFMMTIRM